MVTLWIVTLLLQTGVDGCIPMRWTAASAEGLARLEGSGINCLAVPAAALTPEFVQPARARGFRLVAIAATASEAQAAVQVGADALWVEGDTDPAPIRATAGQTPVLHFPPRASMNLNDPGPVAGTAQGLWPGIHVEKEGALAAAPTGAPWIDTNSGFLRYLRASVPADRPVWIANRPPAGTAWPASRYIQAIGDAALAGARWVVDLDEGLMKAVIAGDERALAAWRRIASALIFYERNSRWRDLPDYSTLTVLQDTASGALYSGGFLDMIGARHVPVTVAPAGRILQAKLPDVRLLLNIDPSSLTDAQRDRVREIARGGAMVVNGPPGWKLDAARDAQRITFDEQQIRRLDEAWREINSLIGRRNFAARIFGAPSMLSSLKATADRNTLALHLVNYSDYPVESISVHLTGKFTRARLLTPRGERPGDLYPLEDGTGVDIDRVEDVAILLIER
jgi:hypothetical protein